MDTPPQNNAAPELWTDTWRALSRATVDKKHNFSTGTLSTLHAVENKAGSLLVPRSRTVVLRKVDAAAGALLVYTDARSVKMLDLGGERPYLSWCFWDRKSSVQVSGYGVATIINGEEARRRFLALPKHGRKSYATLSAPSSPIPTNADGLPANWEELSQSETNYAADNFVMLRTTMLSVDILKLSRAGHQRLHAEREGLDGDWNFSWVVP